MCARRVRYDGGGPLESRRYVQWLVSGRVEDYGENGAVPLWLVQAAVVQTEHQLQEMRTGRFSRKQPQQSSSSNNNNSGADIRTSGRRKDVR
jgi:hypothetical protein